MIKNYLIGCAPLILFFAKTFLQRPFSKHNSLVKGYVFDSQKFRPLFEIKGSPTVANHNIATPVVCLFFVCSPATIFLTVVSVIVYALQHGVFCAKKGYMFLIGGIHVFLKFLKRFPPHLNPPTPIPWVFMMFFVTASLDKGRPLRINRGSRQSVCPPMVGLVNHKLMITQ